MCKNLPRNHQEEQYTGPSHIYRRRTNCKLENNKQNCDHQPITCSIKRKKGNIASEKKITTLEEQISMQ